MERKAKALLSCFRRLDIGPDPSCTFVTLITLKPSKWQDKRHMHMNKSL